MRPPKCIEGQMAFNAIRMFAALSYLYYVMDDSPVPDSEFDELCKFIDANRAWIELHDLNGYIPSGPGLCSGFQIANKVCGQTKEYAEKLLADYQSCEEKPKKLKPQLKTKAPKRSLKDLLG